MRALHPAAVLWVRLVAAGGLLATVELLAASRPADPVHLSMALLVAAGGVAASALARNRSTLGSVLAAFGLTAVVAVAIYLGVLATTFAAYFGWVPSFALVVLGCLATCAAALVLWVGSPRTWELSRSQRMARDGALSLPTTHTRAHDPHMDADR